MRKFALLALASAVTLAWGTAQAYTPGIYKASAPGMGGPVEVTVEFSKDAITSITVSPNKETPGIGSTAVEQLPDAITKNQSLGVDSISGATRTSSAIKAAVADCVKQAGGDPDAIALVPIKKTAGSKKSLETDLLIVGAGGAGQVASIRASQLGKKVILVEKMPFVGGAAAINGGTVVIQGSKLQRELGVLDDSPEIMRQDLLKNGHQKNDLGKLSLYVNGIGPTIDWLLDTGLKIDTKAGFTNEAEYSKPRCIRWVGGAPANMKLMFDLVKQSGTQVFTGTRVEKLLEEHGRVVGVEAEGTDGTKYTIRSRAVLLATGGFGYAKDLLTGNLKQSLYYGPVSSTGDGHKMAKAGKRVISETASNNAIKNVELKQPKSMLYILMDQPTFELFKKGLNIGGITEGEINTWIAQDGKKSPLLVKAETIEAAAEKLGINAKNLVAEAAAYNGFVKAGKDAAFDRPTKFMTKTISTEGPFYIIEQQPRFATTMGGVVTNDDFNVLDDKGNKIEGLFAAGELVGGAMGDDSPPGGNMGWAVTSGRLAAEGAVKTIK